MPRKMLLPDGRVVTVADDATYEDVLRQTGFSAFADPVAVRATPRKDETKSDFIDDMQRSIGSLMSGAGSALRDVNEDAGQWLQGWGNEIVRNNPADYASLDDIKGLGDLAGFAFERTMEFVPQFAGAVGASVFGSPLAGAAVLAAPTAVSTYGEARESQREQGVYDPLRAGLVGAAAGGLELLGIGRMLPGKGALVQEVFEQGLKGAAKQGAKTAGEETLTEVGQTGLQRYGGYQDLTSPEAIQEYAFSGLAGGILGGGIGAGRAALSSAPSAAPDVPPVGAEPLSAFTPMATAQPIEAPPGLAEAPALRTVDIADVTAPDEGAMTTLQILTEPDERGNLWVRTPEGEVSPMNKFTLDILTGGDVGVEAPVAAQGEAGLTTPAINVTEQPISAVPITQPIDVTEPAPVITPEAPEVTAAAPKVGIRRAIWAGPEYDIPIEVLDEPSQAGPDGNMYQQVRTPEGNTTFVPYNQIRFEDAAPPAAPIDVTGAEAAPPEPAAPEMADVAPPTAAPIGMQVPVAEPTPEPEVAPVPEAAPAPAPAPEQYVFTREKAEEVGSHDPQLAQALIGKTVSGGAEVLAQRTKAEPYKMLANRIAGVARAMEGAGIRMPIGITAVPGGQGQVDISTLKAAGKPYTGGVTRSFRTPSGVGYEAVEVAMRGKPTKTVKGGANERTLLHELLHSVTTGAQRMSDQFAPDSRVGQALKDIKALHDKVRQGVADIQSGKLKVDIEAKAALARLQGSNAFLNERELLAWGMTDYDMQTVLKAIPTKGGNAFTDFVRLIGRMLGVGPKDMNALRELIELTEVVVPTEAKAQQEIVDVVSGKAAAKKVETEPQVKAETDMEAAAPSEPNPTESQSARESRIRRSLNALRTSKFYQNIGSKYAGARAADQALAQSYGLKELPEASSLAGAFEVYEATKSAQIRKLKSDYIDPVNQAAEEAAKNGVTPDDWNDALQARAAKARNAKIAEASKDKNGVPKIPDGGSGMTNAQADETLAALQLSGKMPYINKVLEAHDRLRDYSQKIAVESGLISRQTMDAWRKAEPDYTPFKGWAASGDNVIPGQPDPHGDFGSASFTRQFGANGRPFRQAKGRSTAAANSLYNMVADAQYIVEMAEKNKVTMQLKSMYRNNPGAFQGLIRVYDALNPKFIKGKPAKFSDPKAFKNAIRGFENGKVFFIETAPTEEGQTLLSAYQNMSPPQYAEWVKKLNNAMSTLRGLNTRYNPTFWPREFLRSVEDAVNTVYIEKGRKESAAYGKAAALNAFKYSWRPSTLGGVRAFITNTDPRSEEARVAKERVAEMVANGGEAGFEFAERAAAVAERMEKALRELTTEGERKKTLETKAGMMKMMKAVNGINEFVDLAPRAAAYMALTDAGVPVKEAARIALRSTLDHTKRGRYASLLDSLFWFTTPSITNLTKKVRALDSATGRRLMIAHTALGFGIAFLNMMNAPDSDDDGENDYSQLPEWRKLAFTHIYYSPDASPLVLPTGFLFAFERYLGSKLAEVMAGSASETQAATSITKAASDVGSAFLHTLPSMIGGVDGRSIVPSVLAPMYDLAVNENYFNSPIYNKPFDESVAKASISKASTPQIYKDIAEGLQSATGGFGKVRGGIDVSPDQLKYFVDQYTGGTGRFVRGLATGDIEQLAKVNPLDFDPNLIRNAPIQRFYERAPLMKRAAYVENNGTMDELDQFAAAYPVESDPYVVKAYKDSVQEMKDLSEGRGDMTPDEYRDERNAIMSRFNQVYNEVKKEREE